jgi:hypothetical protein
MYANAKEATVVQKNDSRSIGLFAGVTLCAFVCLLLLLGAELVCRLLLYRSSPPGMIFDARLLYRYAPHATANGIVLNNIGCIGPDLTNNKPPGERRVFLLGGSTSFSARYVQVVSDTLNAQGTDKFVVISCGRPRYTSYINRVYFETHLLSLHPDIVALYMGINDNIYNSFPWVTELPDVGYFNYKERGLVSLRFVKYHLIDKKIRARPNFSQDALRSVSIFEANVSAILDTARAHGIRAVLSTFAISYPTAESTLMASLHNEEPKMLHFWGSLDSTALGVEAHNVVSRNLGRRYDVPLAEVAGSIPRDSVHFNDMCHLTNRGNDILGTTIAAAILRTQ